MRPAPDVSARAPRRRRARPASTLLGIGIGLAVWGASTGVEGESPVADFLAVAAVFAHPRCANCHSGGDRPLQTDASRPHAMNVRRGAAGTGVPGARCDSCHAPSPIQRTGAPPAAMGWRMPSPQIPMAFGGKRPDELCAQLKDPAATGRASLGEALEHVLHDGLVRWAFAPGGARTTPPLGRDAFFARLGRWARAGAPCPRSEPEASAESKP